MGQTIVKLFAKPSSNNISKKNYLTPEEIPSIFKFAHITPIQKPGQFRTEAENYLPVSLTSHIIETFESSQEIHLKLHGSKKTIQQKPTPPIL